MYAKVLVQYNAKSIDKTFTYRIPSTLQNKVKKGMKVLVPFGTNTIRGFVLEVTDTYEGDYDLKEVLGIEEEELVLNDELMSLGFYLKEQTLCSGITAFQTMLPASLKVKEQATNYTKYDTWVIPNRSEEELQAYMESHPNNKRQVELLEQVLMGPVLKKEVSRDAFLKLESLGLVKEEKTQKYRISVAGELDHAFELTEEQEQAVQKIEAQEGAHTFLLYGVTGSGKTEVYMRLMTDVLAKGKTAILLVPEISLTAQIVKRFYKRFGDDVAIFHSALSEGEKYDEYLKILRGEVHIVIGTRSAIFVPLQNLGIIIMDEEHSDNYKQDTTPRYHARDMAEFRSKYHQIPLVLGSATPSLESMARAQKGTYTLVTLTKRIGSSVLPTVHIVDMAEEMKKRNYIFSELLKNKIKERLEKKEQIILLLNRRGFSTIITCQNCGYTYKCPHCDISLTYHKTSNHLRCHYCGYTVLKAERCPNCKEDSLNYMGLGTEKLEETIQTLFPEASVLRMDVDTTTKKGSHAKMVEAFANHEYDILLGTQMISKGFDFPLVTLVGVISADTSLNIPDFRSAENTYALLSQASGRAGRSTLPGEVILQTFNPDNKTLLSVQKNDYMHFYENELKMRKALSYPPYYYLASIKVISKDYEMASKESSKVAAYLKQNLSRSTTILGPTTASMFKVNNTYRFSILLKYRFDDKLKDTLKALDELYIANAKVHLEIDLCPRGI